jgi:hypothetical protein
MAGTSVANVKRRLADLERIGAVKVVTPALKSPCTYTLLAFGDSNLTIAQSERTLAHNDRTIAQGEPTLAQDFADDPQNSELHQKNQESIIKEREAASAARAPSERLKPDDLKAFIVAHSIQADAVEAWLKALQAQCCEPPDNWQETLLAFAGTWAKRSAPQPQAPELPLVVTEQPRPKAKKGFVEPTLEEVKLHAVKIGLPPHEADRFVNYYSANGWKIGRNPMVSWKHALSNWKTRHDEHRNTHSTNSRNAGIAADPSDIGRQTADLVARRQRERAAAMAQRTQG